MEGRFRYGSRLPSLTGREVVERLGDGQWHTLSIPMDLLLKLNQFLHPKGREIVEADGRYRLQRFDLVAMVESIFGEQSREEVRQSDEYVRWKATWYALANRAADVSAEQLEANRQHYASLLGREVTVEEFQARLPTLDSNPSLIQDAGVEGNEEEHAGAGGGASRTG